MENTVLMQSQILRCVLLGVGIIVGLTACQSTPVPQKVTPHTPPTPTKPSVTTSDGVKITTYDYPEIIREKAPKVPIVTSQPKVLPTPQKFDDGRETPAVKHLLQATKIAFQQGKWAEAEKYALHVQRLAPQSDESYYWLSEIALKQNKASNAESLARRGLSYAQTQSSKKQLWQVILKSGQIQKNTALIQEAQTRLKAL